MERWISPSKLAAFLACPHQYRLRFRLRVEPPGPRPPMLVAGDLLHRTLAYYAAEPPETDADVIALLDQAASELEDVTAVEREAARLDVVGPLLDYHHCVDAHVVPYPCGTLRTESPLQAKNVVPGLVLFAKADAVWSEEGSSGSIVNVLDWKTSCPPNPELLRQFAILHCCVRANYPHAVEIRRWMVSMKPEPRLHSVPLTVEVYRSVLKHVFDVAVEIGRSTDWEAHPGDACAICRYIPICEYARDAIRGVSF